MLTVEGFWGYCLSFFAGGLLVLLELARCGRGAGVGAVLGLEVVFGVTAYPFFDLGLPWCWS